MGTDYTSFSPLTQNWNEDPTSVVDSKGRQVFQMDRPPADWVRNPKYGHLVYDRHIMLDHVGGAIRDIPGLPLTLDSDTPGWLLAGLRKCMAVTYSE